MPGPFMRFSNKSIGLSSQAFPAEPQFSQSQYIQEDFNPLHPNYKVDYPKILNYVVFFVITILIFLIILKSSK